MPQLQMAQALRRLEQGQIEPLYVLYGQETYLIQEHTATLVDRIVGTAPRDFNYDSLPADSETLQEALALARTLPMMARYRVVVLQGIQQLRKADVPPLEAYAAHPSESTALICTSHDSESKKIPPRLWQRALAVECKPLEGNQLRAWVVQMITRQGCTVSDDGLEGFLQEQANDLWTLACEIEKLCTYVGEAQRISLADVQAVCHASQLQSIFALSDAIGARQPIEALSVVNRLLQQGEPPLVILSMIIRHLRLLWSMRQLVQQRASLAQVARTLHLPQRVCRQLAAQSRLFTSERLCQLYTAALAADLRFKTSNTPPQAILEGLVLELCVEG